MKKKWKIVLCVSLTVALLCGVLAVWLINRTPEDTDPEAPFADLSDRQKQKVLKAIETYWREASPKPGPGPLFWYGELKPGQDNLLDMNYGYGVQYYGTFGGYHIILLPVEGLMEDRNEFYAYKDGIAEPLEEVYESGRLSDEQISKIKQCYERYREEIYVRGVWENRTKNKQTMLDLCVCCAAILIGICVFCFCRNRGELRIEQLRKVIKKNWEIAGCVAITAVSVVCLIHSAPSDTDPDAAFEDLSPWSKEKILQAVTEYWQSYNAPYLPVFWYGELCPGQEDPLNESNYRYGVRYCGTVGGYRIVLAPKRTDTGDNIQYSWIAGYEFPHVGLATFFAYRDGVAVPLHEIYEYGQLSKEQIGVVYQCYEQYYQEVYTRKAWEEYEKDKKNVFAVYVCGAVAFMGAGIGVLCRNRKRRTKNILQCNHGE